MLAVDSAVDTGTSGLVLLGSGLLTFLGVLVTAFLGYLGHRQSKANGVEVREINNAVNHKGPDQLRLFDMVAETHAKMHELAAFQARWEDMPPGLSTAQEVVSHLSVLSDRIHETGQQLNQRLDSIDRQNAVAHRGFEDHIGKVESKVDDAIAQLSEHVTWERDVKWPSLELPITLADPTKETPE